MNLIKVRATMTSQNPSPWREFYIPENLTLRSLHSHLTKIFHTYSSGLYSFKIHHYQYTDPYFKIYVNDFKHDQSINLKATYEQHREIYYDFLKITYSDIRNEKIKIELLKRKENNYKRYYPWCIAGEIPCHFIQQQVRNKHKLSISRLNKIAAPMENFNQILAHLHFYIQY